MAATSQSKELFEDYDGFVEKFKPKRTTDDCFTPPDVYGAVKTWACARFGIDPESCVRPFWPGGDYESFDYPEGCTVLDNPPFSILSKVCAFYLDRGIPFFLFAPALTAFSGKSVAMRMNHVFADSQIEYENEAVVRTAFVTSFGDAVAETAPDLGKAIDETQRKRREREKKQLPHYAYPDNLATAAMLGKYAKYGIDLRICRDDCILVSSLDSQRAAGKAIFGGGLLLSDAKAAERAAAERAAAERAAAERAAAERAAAERAAAHAWELSDRERELVARLG